MQRVLHEYANIHGIFTHLESAYAYTSTFAHDDGLFARYTFSALFQPLFTVFEEQAHVKSPAFTQIDYQPLNLPTYDEKNVIIAFSGGKDSIATALKYREKGYNVYLYHATHINPSLSDERLAAEEFARQANMPLYVDAIHLHGKHDWMEHPMKNMMIANGAIHYGIANGIGTHIVFGNYTDSVLSDNAFERCGGDCADMWSIYQDIVRVAIPNFQLEIGLQNINETMSIIAKHTEYLDTSISCLCRASLRSYRHEWILQKFGINLPKHRCGNCAKCVTEYIYLADHDLLEFSADYYKYCMKRLLIECRELGITVHNPIEVWQAFEYYDPHESKLFDIMDSSYLLYKTIKWSDE